MATPSSPFPVLSLLTVTKPDYCSYYYFIGPAFAAVLLLVIKAAAIIWSSEVHELLVGVGAVASGLSSKELQRRIPERSYRREEMKFADDECSVCLSKFADGQRVRRLPHCRHLFHISCIDLWLASHFSCPVCRSEVLAAF